ncbi:cupin domain-containing protein [Pantoea sp. Ap-967]|uniref:cupin domain-containing protein n=1 Tax=Pantoea sp. Ap-967 TaxID=2608362 RepID=UPI0014223971|nr:cupin domain-containing protein [Pantoea sp. Ap-967]NIE75931.1 cupin domain-containing protein [Pantoea sp. Ap-967]
MNLPAITGAVHAIDQSSDAQFYEYSKAANPIGAGLTPKIPYSLFPEALYDSGPSRLVPLDLSAKLKCTAPATGPGLCANFIRLNAEDSMDLQPNATSQVMYVIDGSGELSYGETRLSWDKGCFIALPGLEITHLTAKTDSRLYYVHDEPLLQYLGVKISADRFRPTLYPANVAQQKLREAADDPRAGDRSRISILLGNRNFEQTRTVTHVLWAMYGIVPPGAIQKPHRHQSIALDFIVDCPEGCYTLVGTQLDDSGQIKNPRRVDWSPGLAFVTPPGYWHAHYNESEAEAFLIPIQDAGLQTYLRSLDIRFT